MTAPRIERLPSGGWSFRIASSITPGAWAHCHTSSLYVASITVACDLRELTMDRRDRAARLLRYLHRYDEFCSETPTFPNECGYWWLRPFSGARVVFAGAWENAKGVVKLRLHESETEWTLGEFVEHFPQAMWMRAHVPKVAGPTTTKEGE